MLVLEDTLGAPMCGCERIEFDSCDDLIRFIDGDEGVLERLESGYATVEEI